MVDHIWIKKGVYYYYYESFDTLAETLEVAKNMKKENRQCHSQIFKTVKGFWGSKPIFRLYLSKVATFRMG